MEFNQLIRTCSIWRALEVVGDTPTLLILEAAWLGARQFSEFEQRTGLFKTLLSQRLKTLVAAKVMTREDRNPQSKRQDYILTEKGFDLQWTALMLLRWEKIWGRREGKIAINLTHRLCGKDFMPTPACGNCHEDIDPRKVTWREGPGVGLMAPLYRRRRQQRETAVEATSLLSDAAQIMGDRWASLIMRSIFTGISRYDDIRNDTAISTNILAERLNWLIEFGVVRTRIYETAPARYEYRITRKGMDYYYAMLMLMIWGDKYFCSPEGPPLLLTHECGARLDPQVVCSECREPIGLRDIATTWS